MEVIDLLSAPWALSLGLPSPALSLPAFPLPAFPPWPFPSPAFPPGLIPPRPYPQISDATYDRNHEGNNSPTTVLAETPLVPHDNVPEYPASTQDSNNTNIIINLYCDVTPPGSSHLATERLQSLGSSTQLRAGKPSNSI